MNNFFTTIFASEKTPKWFKILIKYGMILLLLILGIVFTYSTLKSKEYFGFGLSIIYNLIIIAIFILSLLGRKGEKSKKF